MIEQMTEQPQLLDVLLRGREIDCLSLRSQWSLISISHKKNVLEILNVPSREEAMYQVQVF